MANGTNPRGAQPRPGTRAKAAALARAKFVKAQEYRDKVRAAGRDANKLPARDIEREALAEVHDGKRTVPFHTHRHDDSLTAVRLKQEFGFNLVLQHATEAWQVADEIVAANVPVSVIVIDAPGGKLEAMGLDFKTAGVLEKAGALVGFHTDDGITDSRFFLRSAALAVRAGMTRDGALRALTINNARMLNLDGRLGSLEAGKDADFIVLSGDPFSIYTHVEQSWVEGSKVFDLSDPKDREYAVGAYGINGVGADAHVEIH
jgi:imidazolonepropionase-like amidohydrolase